MLRISINQTRKLADARRAEFERGLVRRLQDIYSDDDPEEISDEALRHRVHHIVDRALSYAIELEEDVTHFVEIAFEVGDDFDTDPENEWALTVLHDPMLGPSEKVQELLAILEAVTELEDSEQSDVEA